jgi:hypothetical protein
MDHFSIKATLQKVGVQILSVSEPIDANPEGRLMETMLAGFAQFDNDVRAARTVQGMRRKIQGGIYPWKPPLGYKSSRTGREKKNRPDEPDQPVFDLLQKSWQQFATGIYTKEAMRRLMKKWGVVTRAGKPLSKQSLSNLFSNPYYAGVLYDPWSGEEHSGLHVAMVSREEFAQVQLVITGRNRSIPHQKHREAFRLRGLVRCQACKKYLTGSFSRGRSKRYAYYHCNNLHCGLRGRSSSVGVVDEEFMQHLPTIAPKAELLGKLGDLAAASAEQRAEALSVTCPPKTLPGIN